MHQNYGSVHRDHSCRIEASKPRNRAAPPCPSFKLLPAQHLESRPVFKVAIRKAPGSVSSVPGLYRADRL